MSREERFVHTISRKRSVQKFPPQRKFWKISKDFLILEYLGTRAVTVIDNFKRRGLQRDVKTVLSFQRIALARHTIYRLSFRITQLAFLLAISRASSVIFFEAFPPKFIRAFILVLLTPFSEINIISKSKKINVFSAREQVGKKLFVSASFTYPDRRGNETNYRFKLTVTPRVRRFTIILHGSLSKPLLCPGLCLPVFPLKGVLNE